MFPQTHDNEVRSLTQSVDEDIERYQETTGVDEISPPQVVNTDDRPDFDPSLPIVNTLIIPSIGVNTPIEEGIVPEEALSLGPWRVNDFGTPDSNQIPIIIASHRWGGVGWDSQKRESASFLQLPTLQVGDRIEIIWDQRKYVYEIYDGEESTYISDYDADLILYTCKVIWESPVRILRYANRVDQ